MLDIPLKVCLPFPLANTNPSWSESAAPKSAMWQTIPLQFSYFQALLPFKLISFVIKGNTADMNVISMDPLSCHCITLFVICLSSNLYGC